MTEPKKHNRIPRLREWQELDNDGGSAEELRFFLSILIGAVVMGVLAAFVF